MRGALKLAKSGSCAKRADSETNIYQKQDSLLPKTTKEARR